MSMQTRVLRPFFFSRCFSFPSSIFSIGFILLWIGHCSSTLKKMPPPREINSASVRFVPNIPGSWSNLVWTPTPCEMYRVSTALYSVDRTPLWSVLARFGVPQKMVSVIRQFHDDMRACVRLDDRLCSGWLTVEQSLRQGWVLAPLLSNIFFAVVINVVYTRFKTYKGIVDALVHLREKTGAGERGGATSGEPVLETSLWGTFYADDAGVVSQSPERLRKMMGGSWSCARRLASDIWPHRIGGQD